MNTCETSKGIFQLAVRGGGKGYTVNAISECCLGFFILKEDNTREYFTSIEDILKIRKAFKNLQK